MLEPSTVDDAVALLAKYRGDVKPLAGGTDLVASFLRGDPPPAYLISITSISELSLIQKNGDLRIGAATTFHQIDKSALVREDCTMLAEATAMSGSRQIRNLGTIGGNICNAVPSADSAPPLLAADAVVVIASPRGQRNVPIANFFKGPRQTVLDSDELVTELILPARQPLTGTIYQRFSPRRALDLAVVGVAASVTLDPATQRVREARIALGAVAPVPQRVPEAEALLMDNELSDELISEVADAAVRISKPRSSIRGSAEFKREMIRVLMRRCVGEAARRAKDKASTGATK